MEVNYFGFLTIPGLCLIAFLVVAIGVWLLIKQNSKIISN